MMAMRILFSIVAATLLMAGCTGQLPTGEEANAGSSLKTGVPTPSPEQENLQFAPQSSSPDTAVTTSRGIGTIGSNG
jgi:hypothetical protein